MSMHHFPARHTHPGRKDKSLNPEHPTPIGWTPNRLRTGAPRGVPGWPRLQVLRAGALPTRTQTAGTHLTRSCIDDDLLLRLAGGSPLLTQLGLRGAAVTAGGLRALVGRLGGNPGTVRTWGDTGDEDDARHGGPQGFGGGGGEALQVVGVVAGVEGAVEVEGPVGGIEWLEVTQSALCCDEGMAAIGDLLGGSLRMLIAQRAGSAVTDEGLACLQVCGRLRELDVGGSDITDEGGWRGRTGLLERAVVCAIRVCLGNVGCCGEVEGDWFQSSGLFRVIGSRLAACAGWLAASKHIKCLACFQMFCT